MVLINIMRIKANINWQNDQYVRTKKSKLEWSSIIIVKNPSCMSDSLISVSFYVVHLTTPISPFLARSMESQAICSQFNLQK